ncbi:MAG: TetR/AcrR family transcriptional regulator [Roseomonas mucosa]|nr:TetR/AcrR family transcriptional regulator [Roseomonas mucosa]
MPDGRLALIEAATFAFAERGYEAADLRSIARAADVDPGLVRIHFRGKAGLWDACVDAIIARRAPMVAEIARLACDASATAAERLTALIRHYVSFTFAHPEVRQFVVRHAAESSERATLLTERLVRPSYEASLPLIKAGIEAGVIRVRHPAAFFALLNRCLSAPARAFAKKHGNAGLTLTPQGVPSWHHPPGSTPISILSRPHTASCSMNAG